MKEIIHQDPDVMRKACKKLMIDLELDGQGYLDRLLPLMEIRLCKKIHKSTLNMALTGRRETLPYVNLLADLYNVLSFMATQRSILTPSKENINVNCQGGQ